jgi:AraC family transcriptional activator of tynA and feaB
MLARSGFSLPTRTTLTGDWADLLREHFVALDVSDIEDGDGFSGAVHSAQLAHVRVSAVQSMEQRIVRSSSLIKSDGADYLQIGMIRRGSAVVRQDDRECVLRRGDYVLYDTTRPFDWQIEGHAHDGIWGLEVFTWPRSYLSLSDAEVTSLTAIAFDGHAGLSGLLGRFLHDLVNEIGSLVKSVLHATARPIVSRRTGLYESALSAIDARIADPALSPVDVAGSVKVSIRQLHRAFAEHGTTVSRSIRSRRLDGCRREIVQRHGVERSLTQISHRWGFTDLAAFSRAFKAEFGISPRQYRSQAVAPTSTAR